MAPCSARDRETKHKTSGTGRARLVRRNLPPPSLSWGSTVSHTRWGSTVTVRGSRSHSLVFCLQVVKRPDYIPTVSIPNHQTF